MRTGGQRFLHARAGSVGTACGFKRLGQIGRTACKNGKSRHKADADHSLYAPFPLLMKCAFLGACLCRNVFLSEKRDLTPAFYSDLIGEEGTTDCGGESCSYNNTARHFAGGHAVILFENT